MSSRLNRIEDAEKVIMKRFFLLFLLFFLKREQL
jgi:hypothetical protein